MGRRLIFPCGAYFPVKEDDDAWINSAHRAKDGAFRIGTYPGTSPFADEGWNDRWKKKKIVACVGSDGKRHVSCLWGCPTPKRRHIQMGYDNAGNLGEYASCFARLHEDGKDVTPPAPAKCSHCEEQRTYIAACKRAAKEKTEAPDRAKWGKCPSCEQYREMFEDTGLCAGCQLIRVLEVNLA